VDDLETVENPVQVFPVVKPESGVDVVEVEDLGQKLRVRR